VQEDIDRIVAAGLPHGLGFRMTETNSCYRGGKPGVSDTLASALWGADLMLDIAARGGKGINFHGGPGKAIAASNGDHMPGAVSAADQETARKGTFYSPFAGSREEGFTARPILYGMWLAERFAGKTLHACDFDPGPANATAYAAMNEQFWQIALINKDPGAALEVSVRVAGESVPSASILRLQGPALDATSGVTFGGTEIFPASAAKWTPAEMVHGSGSGKFIVRVPPASAALVIC
jgi:hypothetical protein